MTDHERAREREDELAACASELERTRARLAEAEPRLQAAREREQLTASSLRALAERARGELASCLQSGQSPRGSDLLVSGPETSHAGVGSPWPERSVAASS